MESRITPFLMFIGQAEEAMNFYASVFPDADIEQIQRYGEGEGGAEGTVMRAVFRLQNQRFMCIDSPDVHAFGFTPSFSMFVECPSVEEVDRIYALLSDGGSVMMPLGEYPFSRRFAWISDRFGVSWQLSVALN